MAVNGVSESEHGIDMTTLTTILAVIGAVAVIFTLSVLAAIVVDWVMNRK